MLVARGLLEPHLHVSELLIKLDLQAEEGDQLFQTVSFDEFFLVGQPFSSLVDAVVSSSLDFLQV